MEYQHRSGRPDAWLPIIVAVFATLAAAASYATAPQSKQTASAPVTKTAGPRDAYGHLPLSFEENRGQTDSRVKFLARGGGYSLFLTPTEAVLKLRAQSAAKNPRRPGALPKRLLRASTEKQFSVVRIELRMPMRIPAQKASICYEGEAITSSAKIARSGGPASRLMAGFASRASTQGSVLFTAGHRAASNMTSSSRRMRTHRASG